MLRVSILLVLLAGAFARIENVRDHETDAAVLSNRVPDAEGLAALQNAVCDGCQELITEVKDFLNDPEQVEKIKAALRKVCPTFGGAQQDCENLINDDFESLVHQIQPLVADPKDVCEKVKMCSDEVNENVRMHKFLVKYGKRILLQLKRGDSSSIFCDECQFLLGEVKKYVDNPDTQAKLKNYLINSCTELGSLQDQCKELIAQNFGDIITMIDNALSQPKAICAELGLCTATYESYRQKYHRKLGETKKHLKAAFHPSKMPATTRALQKLHQAEPGRASGGCIACKLAFDVFEKFLTSSNETLMAIVQEVQKICNKMPNDVNLQCRDFLGIYGKPVIQMTVSTYVQPDEVCKLLTACTSSHLQFLNRVLAQRKEGRLNSIENRIVCDSCEAAMGTLKLALKEQEVQQELNNALIHAVCTKINPEYEGQCADVINAYFPQIWLVIDDAIDADAICKDLKACT